jgi:hypothetical protein
MSTDPGRGTVRITGWDRAVVIALGSAGCALSYDALQQMAVAIHVRGPLTYLFPVVIDGFIGYGIRALLVLRNAPLRARTYLWLLFGTATTASIWANALHAVRLNQADRAGPGLRLGDSVVAVLSAIAPLALAGAVHLYIVIARSSATGSDPMLLAVSDRGTPDRPARIPVTRTDRTGRGLTGQDVKASSRSGDPAIGRLKAFADRVRPTIGATGLAAPGAAVEPSHPAPADPGGQPDVSLAHDGPTQKPATPNPAATGNLGPFSQEPVSMGSAFVPAGRSPDVRNSDPVTEELMDIARTAAKAHDKLTRKVVAEAIRGKQIPLSNDTLTALMVQLRQPISPSVTSHHS